MLIYCIQTVNWSIFDANVCFLVTLEIFKVLKITYNIVSQSENYIFNCIVFNIDR